MFWDKNEHPIDWIRRRWKKNNRVPFVIHLILNGIRHKTYCEKPSSRIFDEHHALETQSFRKGNGLNELFRSLINILHEWNPIENRFPKTKQGTPEDIG